jgi:hypothetical protein
MAAATVVPETKTAEPFQCELGGSLFFAAVQHIAPPAPSRSDPDVEDDPTVRTFKRLIVEMKTKSPTSGVLTIGDREWPGHVVPVLDRASLNALQLSCGMKIALRKVYHDSNDKDISGDYFYDVYLTVPVNKATIAAAALASFLSAT